MTTMTSPRPFARRSRLGGGRWIPLPLLLLLCLAGPARAQFDGARVYWPLPKNTNIVASHLLFGNANATLDNWEFARANADISSGLFLFTYTRIQPVLGRTANWTLSVPAGQASASSTIMVPGPVGGAMVSVAGPSAYVHGLGDPGLSATINVHGAPGLKAKEYARHDVTTNVGLQLRTTFPLGQYDPDDPASMGSNQFKFRLALPITQAFTDWVPGRRLALDLMPSVVFATANDDYVGQEVEPDPTFAVEAHLSRDMTKKAFLSLDYAFLHGGAATYSDKDTGEVLRESDAMDAHLLGLTVNYTVNDNLQLFLTHMQTLKAEGDDPVVLQGSLFKLTLSWAWHAVLQRARDFHG